jgi:glycosyltransferase involved in cell wall biosynthesis
MLLLKENSEINMLNSKTVSIALCTYNGEEHIITQLESLINQTHKNIEIIIVDDNSCDNTFNICLLYAKNDSRIRVYQNEENLGFNLNFAKAMTLCQGEFIAISDQDDIWCLNKIEYLLAQWQEPTVLIHHGYKIFTEEPVPDIDSKPRNADKCTNIRYLLLGNYVQGCTVMFRRKLLECGFEFSSNVYYDWLLGVVAYKNGYVQYCNTNLIYHRRHLTSSYYSVNRERKDFLSQQIQNINYFISSNLLNSDDEKFAIELVDKYELLFKRKYAISTAIWFMRHRKLAYWTKSKRFPFFSNLLESVKRGRGVY